MEVKYSLAVHAGHNASVALIRDGKIDCAVQEERFTRVKNQAGFPLCAINFCLNSRNLKGSDLHRIAYVTSEDFSIWYKSNHMTNFKLSDFHDYYGEKYYGKKMCGESVLPYLQWLRDDPRFISDNHFDFSYLTDDVLMDPVRDNCLFNEEKVSVLSKLLDVKSDRIEFLDHHTSHAAYAYYASPFRGKDCIVLTMDGWGDGRNQTVWKVIDDKMHFLDESDQNDIGRIYKMVTLLLGMRPDEHEFKVMGLGAYAKDSYVDQAYGIFKKLLKVSGMKIVHNERPDDMYQYLKKSMLCYRFDNIAGAVQKMVEELSRELVENIVNITGIKRLVISGGVAMNVKMNKILSELDCIDDFFVCGSGGDESLSIGGAYLLHENVCALESLNSMYLGPDLDDEFACFDWKKLEGKFSVNMSCSHHEVAKLLINNDVVAVVRDCAEFGARALGNRSILANPSNKDTVMKINEAIKNRDFWMPFALSILEDKTERYIENPKGHQSPFMATAFNTLSEKYKDIHAGTHPYDKTVRPQFISREFAPQYYSLVSAFESLTGIPALLNTSFNLHGEPIVNTIEDAVRTFELSGLDHLYINDKVLISKK